MTYALYSSRVTLTVYKNGLVLGQVISAVILITFTKWFGQTVTVRSFRGLRSIEIVPVFENKHSLVLICKGDFVLTVLKQMCIDSESIINMFILQLF